MSKAVRPPESIKEASSVPIDRHLFLSDLRSFALVDENATISWLCAPRLDGAPLFGSLVGGPEAGHFRISAHGKKSQQYQGHTLIGQTFLGDICVTDFLDCSFGRTSQRAGRSDFVRLIEGEGEIEIEFAPKFDFGRLPTRLSGVEEGLRIECGQQQMLLVSPGCTWEVCREGNHDVARSRIQLRQQCLPLVLAIGAGALSGTNRLVGHMLTETERFWSNWLAPLKLPTAHKDVVSRSALVLRGLCFGPTGAIAAAATTSLPETIGGVRNWDYRYCWPRDACLASSALLRLDTPEPAMRLLDWILGIVLDSEHEQFLSPLYTVTGRKVLGEAEVPEALGYRGSTPVRLGNLAAAQLQLDAVGPIAELMWNLARYGANLTAEHFQLAQHLVAMVQARWRDADSGIWEVRGAQRHYVHSKLMCWYTVRCCAAVARYLGREQSEWALLEAEIREQIEHNGFNEKLQSYVAAYDLPEADAALIWIVLSGFHPPQHPRSVGTLRFIMQRLIHEKSVYRYHYEDSLVGVEGEFIICRCWLIEALALSGEVSRAQELLDELLSIVAPLQLVAEQWDWKARLALGNYPQAYSHLGIINAVCSVEGISGKKR